MPGYKEFLENQILTAENFMDYLMKQAVIVCDTETDRDTNLAPYFRQGMTCYMKDTGQLVTYNGTDWIRLATHAEAITTYDPRDNDITLLMNMLIP